MVPKPEDDLREASTALRGASTALLTTLDRLVDLEAQKRQLEPDDPRLPDIAAEVQSLAAEVLEVATVQSHIVEATHVMETADDPTGPGEPIEQAHRAAHDILEDWRQAERQLVEAGPGSAEAMEALVRTRDLRLEYQRAFEAALREGRRN
jgi:hypothetical protein